MGGCEELAGQLRRIDRVGRPLRRQQRRAAAREGEGPRVGDLRAGEDHRGADPAVAKARVVGDRERGVTAV